MRDDHSIEEAISAASYVDASLLDSGNPSLEVKELGGTGRVHDWNISRKIREAVPVPAFLAGGLKPEHAREAVQQIGSYALDVCSGVRQTASLTKKS